MSQNENTPISVLQTPDGRRTLKLRGDVTANLAADLHRESLDLSRQGQDVLVDCEELKSLDVSTVQILLALKDALISQDKVLQVSGLQKEPAELLEHAGLNKLFTAG
jgi:anti-anti-sigma regulatory factor